MISINATLVVQIIHFLLLTFILNRLMFQPILKLIGDRKEYIEKTQGEIRNLEQETEQLKLQFISDHANARKEASLHRDKLRNQALGLVEKNLIDAQEKVAKIREKADREAEKEIEHTKPVLRDEAVGLAEEIIQRIVGRRIAG